MRHLPNVLILLGCAGAAACGPLQKAAEDAPPAQLVAADGGDDGELVDTSFGAFDPRLGFALPWQEGDTETFYHAAPGEPVRADYLVQFYDDLGDGARAAVAATGARTVGYMPPHTLVVAATDAQRSALEALAGVRAVAPMPSLLRVDPALFAMLPGSHGLPGDGPAHLNVVGHADVVVEVDAPEHLALVGEALAYTGSEVVAEQDWADPAAERQAVRVRVDQTGLGRLGRLAEVVGITPYRPRKLLNARSATLLQGGSGSRSAEARPLTARGLDGSGQRVAVADTGLDLKSCFFKEVGKVAAYQDFAGNGGRRGDGDGHGTHVAGSVAGQTSKNADCGVAPRAQLVVQDCAVGKDITGVGADVGELLRAAAAAGAFVHTNSWGIAEASYNAEARAVDRFVDRHPEMVIVAAAGNDGDHGAATVHSPATAKNVVAVGASGGERNDMVAWFSSQGPTEDGRIKPLLLAPGVNIQSARHHSKCRTQAMSGTSMAAPLVAGGAALVRQYFMEGRYPSGEPNATLGRVPSAALVKAVLLVGAAPLTTGVREVPDMWRQGFGRVRLDQALGLDPGGRALHVWDHPIALDSGETWEACFDVAPGAALDVALTWHDPPARQGAAVALVQDLDLIVTDAAGKRSLGNAGLEGAPIEPVADDRNVEEVVRTTLAEGRACVQVHARQTPLRPQAFALALRVDPRGPIVAEQVRW